jgi:hypothetical protein
VSVHHLGAAMTDRAISYGVTITVLTDTFGDRDAMSEAIQTVARGRTWRNTPEDRDEFLRQLMDLLPPPKPALIDLVIS